MNPLNLAYSLDLGALGLHDVRVIGRPAKTFEGKRYIEITHVWLTLDDRAVDLYPYIGQTTLESMQYSLWTIAFNETTRGKEAAGEVAI